MQEHEKNLFSMMLDIMGKGTAVTLCLILTGLYSHAQEKILWDYPLKPGMEEWATLKTQKQMVDTCQIPLYVLNNLNTGDLVTICLDYPMFNDYLVFNDERRGTSIIINRFNGLKELSRREDGIMELIQVYSDFPILTQLSKEPTSKEYHLPYKLPFLESVLCDMLFLNRMDSPELEKLRMIALNKYADKLQNPDVYDLLFNIKKTMLLIASIMDKQNNGTLSPEQQDVLRSFIRNYNHCPHSLLTEISKIIIL